MGPDRLAGGELLIQTDVQGQDNIYVSKRRIKRCTEKVNSGHATRIFF